MPNIRSAKKRMRQSEKLREANRRKRSRLRSAIKRVRQASTPDEAQAAFRDAERALDRAARTGLIAKNNAARNKRRLAKVASAK